MIVIGVLIGSGIFIVSAESARLVGAPGWLLVVWAVAGLMTMAGSQCGAELGAMLPRTGGQYVFLREAYGPAPAFLFGWAVFLVIQTGKIAAVAVAFATFAGVLFPWISGERYLIAPVVLGRYALTLSTQQLVAVLVILTLTAANTRGVRVGAWIQNAMTSTKTLALLAMIILGLTSGWHSGAALTASSWWAPLANGWSPRTARPGLEVPEGVGFLLLFGLAMVGPLFAQTGWANVTFTAGEVRDPGRNLPRALIAGTALVVALYLLANVAYLATLPLEAIQHAPQNRVATTMMQALLGQSGALMMALAIMVSTFGADNGLILAGARVYHAMARDGLFLRRATRVNSHGVPDGALIAQGIWASTLTVPRIASTTGSGALTYGNVYTQLLEYVVSAELVFYALMVGAVIVLRLTRPSAERPYQVVGYPVTPMIYIAIATLLIADLAYLAPTTAGIGFTIVLSGMPVYWWHRRRSAAI
jgi:APA family basic amino acid/polyamine antiporter